MPQSSRKIVVSILLAVQILLQPLAGGIGVASRPVALHFEPAPPTEDVQIPSAGFSGLTVQDTISATLAVTPTVTLLPELSAAPLEMSTSLSVATLTAARASVLEPLAAMAAITASLPEALNLYSSAHTDSLFQIWSSPLLTVEHSLSVLTPITQSYEFTPNGQHHPSIVSDSVIRNENAETIYLPYITSDSLRQNITPDEKRDRTRSAYIEESTAACNQLLSRLDPKAVVSIEMFWDHPLPPESVKRFLTEHPDLNPLTMIYHWGDHTAWYPFDRSKTAAENIQDFQQWKEEFLTTSIADTADALAEAPDIWRVGTIRAARESLLHELQVQHAQLNTQGLQLTGMRVVGSARDITQITTDTGVDHFQQCQSVIDLQQIPPAEPEGRIEDDMTVRSVANDNGAYDDDTVWRPDHGRTWIVDDEYIKSEFLWTNSSGINATHDAYEHDIWVVEKDYLKCANEVWIPYALLGVPGVMTSVNECLGPAATNLPGAYLDTRTSKILSPDAYEAYTIGSAWGLSIQDNTLYYVHIDVDVENSGRSSSQIRTQPQLSHWAGNWSESDPSPTLEEFFCNTYLEYMGDYPACIFSSDTWPAPGAVAFTAYRWSSMAPQYWGGSPSALTLTGPTNNDTVNGTSVSFTWNTVVADGYRLIVATDSSLQNRIFDQNIGNYSGITLNGFPDNGTPYWWRVIATNTHGNSTSVIRQFTNGPSAAPATPSLSSPGNGANAVGPAVSFQWNSAARAADYHLQLALDSGFNDISFDSQLGGNYNGINLSGMPDNGTEFWWRVRAGNSKGWSGWSTAWRFINEPSAAPATPSLSSPGNGANAVGPAVSFQWNSAARAADYHLQLALDSGFNDISFDSQLGGNYNGINLSGMPDNGTEFWWRVRAGNSKGWSGWSTAWRFINEPSAAPATPSLSSPGNGANAVGPAVSFQWNSAARAADYHLQLALDSGFNDISFDSQLGGNYNGINLSGMPDNGTEFWWRVRAGNSKGWSGWSTAWRFINEPSALPEPPALLTPTDGDNVSGPLVEFRWGLGQRAASHRLQVAVDDAFQQVVFDQDLGYYIGVNLTGFSDQGTQFWWRVKSSNSLGESAWGQTRSFVNGPGERSQVQGIVSDGVHPLSRAVVSIGGKAVMTGEDGQYLLRYVPAGSRQIIAQRQGFANASQEITLAEGETVELNFTLTNDGTTPDIDVSPTSLTFQETSSVPNAASMESPSWAASPEAGPRSVDVVPGQFVIGYKEGIRLTDVRESMARLQQEKSPVYETHLVKSRLHDDRMRVNNSLPMSLNYVVVEVSGDIDRFLVETRQKPEVAFIEQRHYARAFDEPGDPFYPLQHALPRVQLPAAWSRGEGSTKPLVAVVDTGIDYTHPDLASSFGAVKGYDFVDGDDDPLPDAVWESHGTHVAGIIAAARNDGIGIAGAASVTLLSVRALNEDGTGTQDDVADAINWAVGQGAAIINLSLGGSADLILAAAVQNAWNNGVLLVAASGNSSQAAVSYPAAYPEVLAVGALNQANQLVSFSNYGAQQELVAPGTTVLSAYPQNDYAVASGTSMAAPLVAGVAALVLSHTPTLTNAQLRAALVASADDLGTSGRDNTYGYGRVNALAALDLVLGPRNTQPITVRNLGQALLEVNNVFPDSAWLVAMPRQFTVWPGAAQVVYVTVDAAALPPASYSGTLILESNAPNDPTVEVSVELDVERATTTATVPLASSWNLVSLPLLPDQGETAQLLASLADNYTLVYAYQGCAESNPWQKYDPTAPAFANDLTEIDATMGFWMQMTDASLLALTGADAGATSIALCPGWNLVGFPSRQSLPVAGALSSIEGCYDIVYGYDAFDSSDPWKKFDPSAPAFANDLAILEPGRGYWIKTNAACIWTISEEGG